MRVVAWALLTACMPAALAAEVFAVPSELWDRPRAARAVLGEAVVKQAVNAHLAQPGSRLVIHHGLGQDPMLQAEELRAWLMVLAVDAEHISLVANPKLRESLNIEIVK